MHSSYRHWCELSVMGLMAHIFLSGGVISLVFVPKVILSFIFCLRQWAFLSWLVALLFSFSFECWWVVFSALNFQDWLVFLSETKERLVLLWPFGWKLLLYLCFGAAFFFFSFFLVQPVIIDLVNYKQCIYTLFMISQITFFSNFFIKNRSHNTIYTFKNYFAIVFSVSVFNFNKNKLNPNTLFTFLILVSLFTLYVLPTI